MFETGPNRSRLVLLSIFAYMYCTSSIYYKAIILSHLCGPVWTGLDQFSIPIILPSNNVLKNIGLLSLKATLTYNTMDHTILNDSLDRSGPVWTGSKQCVVLIDNYFIKTSDCYGF